MRTVIETIYHFSELPGDVQARLLDHYRIYNIDGTSWDDDVWMNFTEIIKEETGVDLAGDAYRWDGFWSQESGASFTHDFTREELKRLLHHFNITVKHGLEDLFLDVYTAAIHRTSSYYAHENTVTVHSYLNDTERDHIDDYFLDVADLLDDALEQWKDKQCRRLYKMLKDEYEELTSDAAVAEAIEANGLEFYADGKEYAA